MTKPRRKPRQVPLHEHRPRRADHLTLRGDFLMDWQSDEGAVLDAPHWLPRGSTDAEMLTAGRHRWFLRSAFVFAGARL
jgi:hypothetical protein